MYAVGSLISQVFYTVSGPFHPFGGAVDTVVVQQQDGSLKSSPWYVKFGKFQGVLNANVRVVDINVNGVDANFHMYLDRRGEAYFLREVDKDEVVEARSLHSSSCEDIKGNRHDNSVSDVSNGAHLSKTNSKRSRILGFVLGKWSMKEHKEENDSNVGRMTQLESAEIVDLLEMRWSTNLSYRSNKNIGRESRNDEGDVIGGRLEASLFLCEQHFVNKLEDSRVDHEAPAMKVEETIVTNVVEEQLIFGDLDYSKTSINKTEQEVKRVENESTSAACCQDPLTVGTDQEHVKGEVGREAKSLPNMSCHFNDPITDNHEDPQFDPPVGKVRSSNCDLLREDSSRIKKANLEKELQQNADNLSSDLKDGSIVSGGPPDIVGGGGRWRLWPFGKLGSKNVSENIKTDSDVYAVAETDVEKERSPPKSDKMYKQERTPTPEQLASLHLAEGKNTVTFTFSTSVLGTQKVDARIYLWSWDTRIVISDVDGTITKSDVLGQFMPLVGRDWSHIGVTHLFSAIKENGYQMLYLSARAISQASITRQFLFNLKQDGKALPDGPVVISPDGIFPSLFREVIRRVPHEFKIACLEDIRVCFPSDRNPFYAGFGNRDTDEFSYLKIGIPKGKIFIINPKGEVVINRCVDSRSYASLHALVNGIFPPISVHEEEDYNPWNFWRLPPPTI